MLQSSLGTLSNELSARLPAMLDDLRCLVNMETPTYDKEAVDRAQDYFAERLRWAGAHVDRLTQPELGDHLRAIWPAQNADGRKPILVIGHMDTVWPIGELERRPVREADGFLFGPGVFDMKAGLMLTMHVIRALGDLGIALKRDVIFLVNSDEEIGSLTSRELIEETARGSHCVLVMEPAFREGYVTLARKGVGRFTIHVTGKAAHAGRDPHNGVNAIAELAHHVLDLQSMNDLDPGTTVNVGVVSGGTRPNVVPAEAWAEVDLRISHSDAGQKAVERILGLCSRDPHASVRVLGGLTRPPWEPNTVCEALFHRARTVALALGMGLDKGISGGGSDGNFAAALGLPTLDGLGAEGSGAHAVDERVRIASIPMRASLLAGILLDLGLNGN